MIQSYKLFTAINPRASPCLEVPQYVYKGILHKNSSIQFTVLCRVCLPHLSSMSGSMALDCMSARMTRTAAAASTVSPPFRASSRPSEQLPCGCHLLCLSCTKCQNSQHNQSLQGRTAFFGPVVFIYDSVDACYLVDPFQAKVHELLPAELGTKYSQTAQHSLRQNFLGQSNYGWQEIYASRV